jgi:tRNA(His) 5'-end guanylyltransferase
MGLMEDMNKTTEYLCQNIQGAKFGYVQSDEISILITDYDDITTHAWFDGNLQKMASIAASLATAKFNELRTMRTIKEKCNKTDWSKVTNETLMMNLTTCFKLAMFDARVFQIPYQEEVINYFIWRQQDATRNSISSAAQSLYSHKELDGKKTDEMQEMIFQKGINWNNYSPREKRGALIRKVEKKFVRKEVTENVSEKTVVIPDSAIYTRTKWEADPETPIFSQNKEYLNSLFPSVKPKVVTVS